MHFLLLLFDLARFMNANPMDKAYPYILKASLNAISFCWFMQLFPHFVFIILNHINNFTTNWFVYRHEFNLTLSTFYTSFTWSEWKIKQLILFHSTKNVNIFLLYFFVLTNFKLKLMIYSRTLSICVIVDLFLIFKALSVVWSWTFESRIIYGWWVQLNGNERKRKIMHLFQMSAIGSVTHLVLLVTVFFPWFWIALTSQCYIWTLCKQTNWNTSS